MSSNVSAPAAPDGDNGSPQGHCSRCGKVWTLKERQGVCRWCGNSASCQSTTAKPRHIKSRSNGRRKQPDGNGNGYDQLDGDWLSYYKVASRFTDRVKVEEPEPMTTVRVGSRVAQIPLRRKRREAVNRLMGILVELEGKDIYTGSYEAGGRHFWLVNLKLPRLKLDYYPVRFGSNHNYIPGVIVLWGSRSAQVRIFTDYLVAVREQEYQGYWHWLLDFRNGFYDSKVDQWKSHYACLTITRFKD